MNVQPRSVLSENSGRDAYAVAVRARQAPFPEIARRLSIVSGWRTLTIIALQWVCILGAIAIADHSGTGLMHWLVAATAILVISSRQQALSILIHDAVHYRLFRTRAINDTVCDLFCALPVGLVTARYRHTHRGHHQDEVGPADPDWIVMQAYPREWSWPKTKRQQTLTFLRDLCGLGFIAFLQQWSAWLPLRNHFGKAPFPAPLTWPVRFRIYGFYAAVTAMILGFGLWREFLLYWMLPLATVSQLIFRVRSISEHMGCGPGSGMGHTRHMEARLLERLMISPLNVNHHLTHHLYPAVPWFNLPKLTRQLFDDPEFSKLAYASNSYFGKNGVVRRELRR